MVFQPTGEMEHHHDDGQRIERPKENVIQHTVPL